MDKYPLIGVLALKNKLLLKEDLDKALSSCSKDSESLEEELIRCLISTKRISSKNIEKLVIEAKALKDSGNRLKFGEIAVKKAFISKTNLQFILEEQENDIVKSSKPKLIGDMLIEAGMITYRQRDLILEVQKKVARENQNFNGSEGNSSAKESLLTKPVLVSHGLRLQTSADFLSAFFIKTKEFKASCTVNDIKDILIDKDIIFGIVADEMIVGFLKSQVLKGKPFRVAKGVKPVQGKDAKITCFFNTEHLKAGGVDTEGQIDFKERGKIPQVAEAVILAEKTPVVEAMDGKNIYGETIIVKPGNDIPIQTGKGVKLSENGFQVLATVKGHPIITPSGEICVQEEYVINGDIDYETGHIDYDGNINIKGCIKSGFKVKGNNINAFEIDGGIIEAQGDVKIIGGINSENIYVRGNIFAKFIHKSHILCKGDVSADREIIDAVIMNRGKCLVVNGKIISSEITSKLGVFAKDIGTEKGKPSIIKVGHDIFFEKELQKNKICIDDFNKTLDEMLAKQERKIKENDKTMKGIDEYTQLEKTSQASQQSILSKIESLKNNSKEIEYPEAIKEKLKELQIETKQAKEKIEFYLTINKELEKQIKELGQKSGKQKLRIKNLEFERESLIKWMENNPGKPVVAVSGTIMAKTMIQGRYSRKVLEEAVRSVQARETRDTQPGAGPDAYKIDLLR